ncbi:hypothetical protein DAI22_11g195700 [Oryza sativa Japonica Group]|uniref:Uncharacterized protein n=2 Tax=Oryza TaxID=4527 RepID=Q2R197_ORYSJ|nr:hypothetical protein LOC_Os11g39910 [Oryza sativa Japonica Group]KAF2911640.1 hypothetical protein DAI22_11g195700 [Oryza sativa Japonica Group]
MKLQFGVLLLSLALVVQCSDMARKVIMADEEPSSTNPQDSSCGSIVNPGPCFPSSCKTYCKIQVPPNADGNCTPDGCKCTYCLPPSPPTKQGR